MSRISTPTLSLDQVKAQFQAWRKERLGGARIPQHLWDLAIELLKDYPIAMVKKQLCLNLEQLKKRAANGGLGQAALSKQQFLEIKPGEIAKICPQPHCFNNRGRLDSATTATEGICRIAFEGSDGSRLSISLPADAQIIPTICAHLMKG